MELREVELEFDVEAFFDAHLHLDWSILVWLRPRIGHDELFFLRYPVVIPVDHHVNVVTKSHHYSVVAFKLLLHSIELKVVLHVVSQGSGGFEITHDLEELGVLVLVIEVLDNSDQLDTYTQVVYTLIFVECYGNLTLDVLSVLQEMLFSSRNYLP